MQYSNLNELARIINETNPELKNQLMCQTPPALLSVINHLAAAFGDFQSQKYSDDVQFLIEHKGSPMNDDKRFRQAFDEHIKDTFEDRIAMALMDILCVCHANNIDINNIVKERIRYNKLIR